mmetsp:Transcript_7954/g.20044  ORF Transcript_7954/g.20044 Transcript_7954/m.20044 type:complete len:210 (-) Transcript_7954:186-815(-)
MHLQHFRSRSSSKEDPSPPGVFVDYLEPHSKIASVPLAHDTTADSHVPSTPQPLRVSCVPYPRVPTARLARSESASRALVGVSLAVDVSPLEPWQCHLSLCAAVRSVAVTRCFQPERKNEAPPVHYEAERPQRRASRCGCCALRGSLQGIRCDSFLPRGGDRSRVCFVVSNVHLRVQLPKMCAVAVQPATARRVEPCDRETPVYELARQ